MSEQRNYTGKRRLTKTEMKAMSKMMQAGFSENDIALKLGRSVKIIHRAIQKMRGIAKEDTKSDLVRELRSKHYWKQILNSLKDLDEVAYFEREWASIVSQLMSQDVSYTDEMMVRDLIMQDVCMFRISSATASCEKRKDELENMILQEHEKDLDDRDLTQIGVWRQEITSLHAALTELQKGYAQCQDRKESLFKSLKTTREQRFKEIRESGKDIFSLVQMLDKITEREREGKFTELFRMSAQKIENEWREDYTFADNAVDKILLDDKAVEGEKNEQNQVSGN